MGQEGIKLRFLFATVSQSYFGSLADHSSPCSAMSCCAAGEAEGNQWVHGWEAQLARILETSRNLSFADRISQAAWRGRADGGRDWLRWANDLHRSRF